MIIEKYRTQVLLLMLAFAMMLAFSGMASAADDGLYFKSNEVMDMKTSCMVNGTYCDSTASCNLTVVSPTGAMVLINVPLTNQITFYNYSIPAQTGLGEYSAKTVCYDPKAGYAGSTDFTFTVTSTGVKGGNSLMLVLILFGAGVVLMGLALKMHNEYVGFASGAAFLVTGVYIMIYGLGVLSDFYTRAISYLAIGFGTLILIAAAYDAMDMGATRLLGDPDDEDF